MKDVITPSVRARGRVRAHRIDTPVVPYTFQPAPWLTKPSADGKVLIRTARAVGKSTSLANPGIWTPTTLFAHNDIMFDWATIVSKLISAGDSKYRVSGILLEFANTGSSVAAPAFTRYDGMNYFNGLSGSSADYLRVPLVASVVSSSDDTKFPGGNLTTFFAQTSATLTTGVHGLAFGFSHNSIIYGGALVAIVDPADRTQDLVFSRFYFDTADQQVKLATSQIGVEWEVELE